MKMLLIGLLVIGNTSVFAGNGRLNCRFDFCYNPVTGKCENGEGIEGQNFPTDNDPAHAFFIAEILETKDGQCTVLKDGFALIPWFDIDLRGADLSGFHLGGYSSLRNIKLEGSKLSDLLWSSFNYSHIQGTFDKNTNFQDLNCSLQPNTERTYFCTGNRNGELEYDAQIEYDESNRRVEQDIPGT